MKKLACFAIGLLTLAQTSLIGQGLPAGPRAVLPPPSQPRIAQKGPELTKFYLDFPGGTPAQLVAAIERAMDKPLNVIIPPEDADTQLPPLKMNGVDTPQLFAALEAASRKTVAVRYGGFGPGPYQQITTSYGFKTVNTPASDTSIWYFYVEKPTLPPVISNEKVLRFFSLAPYLDRSFTVDDITTAIQTGWKMSGISPAPELNYHKETKLLIAYGEPNQLNTIESVLSTLPASNVTNNEISRMNSEIKQLQDQVGQLKKKISAATPPPTEVPETKSGK
ncbi:MAG: hypothetical protein M1608_09850 [Candidatus Omnitrophica bacterium]|nr:hypothetical protein [Candidatus Omnitrophota bacterium]